MRCLRVRYTKLGKIRFIGHRDVARIWERSLRKANIPVLYSQGFSPHPRISFGLALPTGFESEAEFVDVYLGEDFFLDAFDEYSKQRHRQVEIKPSIKSKATASSLSPSSSSSWRPGETKGRPRQTKGRPRETKGNPRQTKGGPRET